jgi:predicted DNA-binding transcriptional regulator AlpA
MEQVKTGLATDHQVAAHIKSSRAQVWVLARNNPAFPKPLRITSGMTRWRWADVLEWEQSLKAITSAKHEE